MPDVPKRAIWVAMQTTQPIHTQYSRQSRLDIGAGIVGINIGAV